MFEIQRSLLRTNGHAVLGESRGANSVILRQSATSIPSCEECQEVLIGICEDVDLTAETVIGGVV